MKIFIATYGGGHVNIVINLVKELERQGINFIVFAFPSAIEKLKQNNIIFKTFKDYENILRKRNDYLKEGHELALINHNNNSGIEFIETVWYYGVGIVDLIDEVGEKKAKKDFLNNGRKVFLPQRAMREIIEYENPHIIFTTCSKRGERATQLVGIEKKILTIRLLDTVYLNKEALIDLDYIFCINEYQRKELLLMGINSNKIKITGQPVFDKLFTIKITKEEFCKEMGLNELKKTILWVSGITNNLDLNTKEVLKLAKKNDVNLIIKLHPTSETIEEFELKYGEFLYKLKNVKLIKNYPIEKLIKASDLILTQYSTVGHEAIILDKQLGILNFGRENYPIKYSENGSCWEVFDREDLKKKVEESLKNIELTKEVKKARLIYKTEKNSTLKVIDEIKKMCSRKEEE